jgi:hypothetical protein
VQHHIRATVAANAANQGGATTNDIVTNERHQRRAENVDTVGVTGSIPVSPTKHRPEEIGPAGGSQDERT